MMLSYRMRRRRGRAGQPCSLRPRANAPIRRRAVCAERLELRRLLSIVELDPSYGDGGIARVAFNPNDGGLATAVEALPDGRAYVAAWASGDFALARLTFDGEFDPTFGAGGKVRLDVSATSREDQANDIVVQPDGKVVVGGSSSSDWALVRYLPDGTLDPSFGSGGVVRTPGTSFSGSIGAELKALILQQDGKIVALGQSHNGNHERATIARYNPDGTLDPSFGEGGVNTLELAARLGLPPATGSQFSDGLVLPDGSLVLSGSVAASALFKLTPGGALDTSFAEDGIARDAGSRGAVSIAAAPGGGYYTVVITNGNSDYNASVARWNPDGTVDRSFGTDGAAPITTGSHAFSDVQVQPDGTVVASSGVMRTSPFSLDGFEWATFSPAGERLGGAQWLKPIYGGGGGSIALQPDGRALFVGGWASQAPDNVPLVFRYRTTADAPKGARLEAGVVFVTGDGSDNTLHVSRDAVEWHVVLDGQSYAFPTPAASRVDSRLLGGNDSVTLDRGLPPGIVDLGDGDDTADLSSSVRNRLIGGKGADTFRFAARDGAPIDVALAPGEGFDVVDAAGTDAADSFSLLNGALVLPGWRVGFDADLESAGIDAGGGDDTVTLDILPSSVELPDPFGPAAVVSGGDGNDTFVTHRGPGGRLQEFRGGPGDDRMNVFPEYRTQLAFEAGAGDDRVTFGPFASGNLGIGDSQVSWSAHDQSLALRDAPALEGLQVVGTGGGGTTKYTVTRTAPGVPTTILGGAGPDTFAAFFSSAGAFAALANVSFDGGADTSFTDSVDLHDTSTGSHDFVVGGTTLTRDGVAGPRYTGIRAVSFTAGDGGNHFTVADASGLSSMNVSGGRGADVFDVVPPPAGLGSRPNATVTLAGGTAPSASGADLFRVRPDPDAQYSVWGDVIKSSNPPAYDVTDAGDGLEVDSAGTIGADLAVLGRGYGRYSFSDRRPVNFFDIESVNDIASTLSTQAGFRAGPPKSSTFAFTGDVSGSVSPDDLKVTNLITGRQVGPDAWTMTTGADGKSVTFAFDQVGERLPGGLYRATLPAGSVAIDGPGGPAPLATNMSVEFSQGPAVTAVWVDGSTWTDAFRQRLRDAGLVSPADASLGFPVGPADQSAVIPWSGVDRFSARFDAPVDADAADLRALGTAVGSYGVRSFSYNPETYTATWNLARTLAGDHVRFQLAGLLSADVSLRGAVGPVLLDGEYGGTLPSGDGKPGGNFVFAVNVLTGDAIRDGRVNAADMLRVRSRLAPAAATTAYDVFSDLNADGRLNVLDLRQALASQNRSLPATVAGVFPAPAVGFRQHRRAPSPRDVLT